MLLRRPRQHLFQLFFRRTRCRSRPQAGRGNYAFGPPPSTPFFSFFCALDSWPRKPRQPGISTPGYHRRRSPGTDSAIIARAVRSPLNRTKPGASGPVRAFSCSIRHPLKRPGSALHDGSCCLIPNQAGAPKPLLGSTVGVLPANQPLISLSTSPRREALGGGSGEPPSELQARSETCGGVYNRLLRFGVSCRTEAVGHTAAENQPGGEPPPPSDTAGNFAADIPGQARWHRLFGFGACAERSPWTTGKTKAPSHGLGA